MQSRDRRRRERAEEGEIFKLSTRGPHRSSKIAKYLLNAPFRLEPFVTGAEALCLEACELIRMFQGKVAAEEVELNLEAPPSVIESNTIHEIRSIDNFLLLLGSVYKIAFWWFVGLCVSFSLSFREGRLATGRGTQIFCAKRRL